ncbi:MAG: hypothetical protein DRH26_05720 [Deltaproteobacteria bacterium]|nr:MAG: hypothetical protein DRH26_05720 [Deltaproteobacteria bacterium]
MRYGVARFAKGIMITLMLAGFGCSAAVYEYASSPVSKTVETQVFIASFAPAREDASYFSSFMLEIENKSDERIEIDWNKTLYIHDEKNRGGFAFKGIEPTQLREKRIPNEVIPPRTRFSKQLFPVAKIAMAERKDYSAGKDKPGLYGGKLPPGENSILLSIQDRGQLIRKKISVVITEQVK